MAISSGEPVGQVDSVDGVLTVFREDGSEAELSQGDVIYLNDQVFTDGPSSAVIGFVDGNTIDVAPDSSLYVDEYLYSSLGNDASPAPKVAAAEPTTAQVVDVSTRYGEPAGSVENMQGSAVVVHPDGSENDLAQGDFVYQNDEIFTDEDSALAIRFTDETSFSIGADSALVVDEYVYDPATGDGAVDVSVLKGMFVFVSGLVADKSPDSMSIKTPTATVGIRGTEGMGKIGENGEESYFVNADGIITINTPLGTVVIDQINQTAVVLSPLLPPEMAKSWSSEQVIQTFVSALRVAPLSVTQRVVNADLSLGGDARAVLNRAIKTMKAKQADEKAQQSEGEGDGEPDAKGRGDGKETDEEKKEEEALAEEQAEEEQTEEEEGEKAEEKSKEEKPKEEEEEKKPAAEEEKAEEKGPEEKAPEEKAPEEQSEAEPEARSEEPVRAAVVIDFSAEAKQPSDTSTDVETLLQQVTANVNDSSQTDREVVIIQPDIVDDFIEEPENLVPQTFDVAGLAVDSYIANATVFFDANNNGIRDVGEASTETDAEGNYTLQLPNGASGSIVILAGGTDIATGEIVNVNLSSPVDETIAAGGTMIVSPLSTLVDSLIQSGQSSADALATAARLAGASNSDNLLTTDPIAEALAGNASGIALLQANVAIHALVALSASAIAGASGGSVSVAQASAALFAAIAENPTALESGSPSDLAAIIAQASSATGAGLSDSDGAALSGLLGTVLTAINVADNDGLTDTSAQLVRLAQISDLIQNQLADDIQQSFSEGNFQNTFENELAAGSIDERIATITADNLGVLDPASEIVVSTNDLNFSPIAVSDTATVAEEASINVAAIGGLLSNDSDPNSDAITVSAIRTGSESGSGTVGSINTGLTATFGTLTVAADGSYSYVADQAAADALAAGQTATDTFTYTVVDTSGAPDTAELTITITGVNDGPVGLNDDGAVAEDATLSVTTVQGVLSNDLDVDGDTLFVTNVETIIGNDFILEGVIGSSLEADHGTLLLAADGSYTYTADAARTDSLAVGETTVDTFLYTFSDGNGGTASAELRITITGENDAPTAQTDSQEVEENSSVQVAAIDGLINLNDVDIDGDALNISAVRTGAENATGTVGAVGAGLVGAFGTLTVAADGSYSYVADQAAADALADGQSATDTFTYTVVDTNGETDTAELVITVQGLNDAPVAVGDSYSVDEDGSLSVAAGVDGLLANDSDVDGDTLTVGTRALSDPASGSVTLGADGAFVYTPNANFNGSDSFSYEVSDGNGGSAIGTVNIIVNSVNDAPSAVNDLNTVFEDDSIVVDTISGVIANDVDVEADTLTVSAVRTGGEAETGADGVVGSDLVSATGLGTLRLNADGSYTYAADEFAVDALAEGETATDTFTYTVTDANGAADTAELAITVTGVNDAPRADDRTFTIDEDTVFGAEQNLFDDSGDPESSISINTTPVVDVNHGVLDISSSGSFEYIPDPDFNGTDSFVFEVIDEAGATATATVTINIVAVNDVPDAVDDLYFVDEDGVLEASLAIESLLDNDSDIEGDSLTVNTSPVFGPLNGNVLLNNDGTFTYTPDADFNGSDSFDYEVSDGNGGVSIATATIVIGPVNDAPELAGLELIGDYSAAPLTPFDSAAPSLGFNVSENGLLAASVGNRDGEDFLNVFTFDGETGEFEFSADISLGVNATPDAATIIAFSDDEPVTIQVFTREIDRFDIILFDEGSAAPLVDITAALFGNDVPFSFIEEAQPVIGPNGQTLLSLFSHEQIASSPEDAGVVIGAFGDGQEIVITVNNNDQTFIANTITPENTPGFVGSDSLALLFFGDLLYVTQDDTADIQVFGRGEADNYNFVTTLVAGVDIPVMGAEQLLQRSPDDNQLYVVEQASVEGDPAILHIFDLVVLGEGEPEEGPLQLVASLPIVDDGGAAVDAVSQVFVRDLDTVIVVAEDGRLVSFDNPVDRLPAVDEDSGTAILSGSFGALVSDFVDANDVDGDSIGIAIEEFTGKGDWYFSLDDGVTWQIIDPASLESETDELVLLLAADARIYYEPAPNENGTDVGRLYYSAWDGSDGTNGTVYLDPAFGTALSNTVRIIHADVNPVDDLATAVDDVFAVGVDGVLENSAVRNDFDLEGDDFFIDVAPVSDVTSGFLTINSDGTFTYTPNTGFVGSDSFEYAITDDLGSQVSTAIVTINVTHTPTLTPEDLTFDYSFEASAPFDVASFPGGTELSSDGKFAVSVGNIAGNDVINFYVFNDVSGEFEFDSTEIIGASTNVDAPIYATVNDLGSGNYGVNVFNHDQDRLTRYEFSDTGAGLDIIQTDAAISFGSLFQPINGGGNFFDLFTLDQFASGAVRDDGSRILVFGSDTEIKVLEAFVNEEGLTVFNNRGGLFVGDGSGFNGGDSIALGQDGNILYVTQEGTADIQVFNDTDFGYVQVATLVAGSDIPSMGPEQILQRSPDGTQLYIAEQSQSAGFSATIYIFDILIADDGEPEGLLQFVDSFDLFDGLGNPIEAVAQIVIQELGDVLIVSEQDGEIVSFTRQVERLSVVDEDSGGPIDGVTSGTPVASFLNANDIDGDPLGIAVGSLNGDGQWFFSVDGGTTWQFIDRFAFDVDEDSVLLLLDSSSQLYYEPAPDENGDNIASVAYTVWDGNEGTVGSFHTVVDFGNGAFGDTIGVLHATINPVNDDAVAEDDVFFVSPGSSLDGSVVDNDVDVDGDVLQVNTTPLTDVSNGDLVLNSDGTFTYTPDTGFLGVDSFEYEVSDGISSLTSTALVTIEVNTPPELDPEDLTLNYTVNADVPYSAPGFPAGATISSDGNYLVTVGHDAGNDFIHFYIFNELSGEFEFDSTELIGASTNEDAPIYVAIRELEPNVYQALVFNKDQDRLTQYEFSDTGAGLDVTLDFAAIPYSFVSIPMTDGGNLADFLDRDQTATSAPNDDGVVRIAYANATEIITVENGAGEFTQTATLTAGVTPGFNGSDAIAFGFDGNVLFVVSDSSADIQIFNDGDGGYARVDTVVAGEDFPLMGNQQQLASSPDGTQLYVVEESSTIGVPAVLHIFDILVGDDNETEGFLRFIESFDVIDSAGNPVEEIAQVVVQELGNILIIADDDGRVVSFDTQVDRLLAVDEDSGAPIDGVTLGTEVSSFLRASDADGDAVGLAIGEASGNGSWYFSVDGGATWQFIDGELFDTEDQDLLLLLAADSRVYYEPAPEESGDRVGALTFVAWDGRVGVEGTFHDVLAFGRGSFGDTVGTVHATVTAVNDAPIAIDDNFVSGADNVLEGSVLENDSDVDSALTVNTTPLSDVSNGTLALNSDGTFTYTPATGFLGVDSFEYIVSDGIDSSTATVTIDVDSTPELTPEGLSFGYSVAPLSPFDTAGSPGGTAISDDGLYAVSVGHVAGNDVINFYIFNDATQEFEFDSSQTVNASTNIDAPIYAGIVTLGGGEYLVNVFNRDQDSFSQFQFSESVGLDITANLIGVSFSFVSEPIVGGGDLFDLLDREQSAGSIRDGDSARAAFANGTEVTILERFADGHFEFIDVLQAGVTAGFTGSDSIAFALEGYTLYVTQDDSADIQIFEDVDNGYELVDTLVAGVDIPAMGSEQYLQRSPDGTQLYVVEQSLVVGDPAILHIFDIIISTGDDNGEGRLIFVDSIPVVDGSGIAIETVSQVVVQALGNVLVVSEDDGRIVSLDRPVERLIPVDEDSGAPVSGTVGTLVSSFLAASDADAGDALGIAVGGFNGEGVWYFSTDSGVTWQAIDTEAFDVDDDELLLLLGPDSQVYYQPAPDENGENVAEILYTVWDGREGVEGEIFDVNAFGNGAFGNTVDVVHATVNPVNDEPFANNDSFFVNENDVFNGAVLQNDFDIDGDVLQVNTTPLTDVVNGSLTLNSDGTFTYTPNADFFGSDSFEYQVSDGVGGSDTATVLITINEFNASPEIDSVVLSFLASDQGQSFDTTPSQSATAFSPDGRFVASVGNFAGDDFLNIYILNDATGEYDFVQTEIISSAVDPLAPVSVTLSERVGGEYTLNIFVDSRERVVQYQLAEGISVPEVTFITEIPYNTLSQNIVDGDNTVFTDLFAYTQVAVANGETDIDDTAVAFSDGTEIIIRDDLGAEATTIAVLDGTTTEFTGSHSIAFADGSEFLLVIPPLADTTADIIVFVDGDFGYEFSTRLIADQDIPLMNTDRLIASSPDGSQIYIVEQGGSGTPAAMYIFDVVLTEEGVPPNNLLRLSATFDLFDDDSVAIETVAQIVVGDLQDTVGIVASDGRFASFDRNVASIAPVDEDSGAPIDGVTAGTLVSSFLSAEDAEGDTVGIAVGDPAGEGNWYFSTDGGATWQFMDPTEFETEIDDFLLPLAPDARVYYEPAPDENGGAAGRLFFVAWDINGIGVNGVLINDTTVSFGNGADFGDTFTSVIAEVNPIDDDPIGVDDEFLVLPDTQLQGNVLFNDELFDVDGDELAVNITPLSDVTNGVLTLNSDGSFSYTPDTGFIGGDSFTYEVFDADGGSAVDTAIVTLTVEAQNQSPVLNLLGTSALVSDDGGNFIGPLFDFDSGADAIFDPELAALDVGGDYTGASITFNVPSGDGTVVFFDDDVAFGPTSNLQVGTSGGPVVTDGGSTIATITPVAEGFRLDFVSNGGQFADQAEANDIVALLDFELTNLDGTAVDVSVDDGVVGVNDSNDFGALISVSVAAIPT